MATLGMLFLPPELRWIAQGAMVLGAGEFPILVWLLVWGARSTSASNPTQEEGIAVGAAILSSSMTTLLFNVRPTDPAVSAVVSLVLIAVALLASYVPARRAARIDPLTALRDE